jgi:hypothetical protein
MTEPCQSNGTDPQSDPIRGTVIKKASFGLPRLTIPVSISFFPDNYSDVCQGPAVVEAPRGSLVVYATTPGDYLPMTAVAAAGSQLQAPERYRGG